MSEVEEVLLDKGLPSDTEAERMVLGSVVLSPAALDEAVEFLRPEDFHSARHKIIYRAMLDLSAKEIPLDGMTLFSYLSDTGKGQEAGGLAYVCGLDDGVPIGANMPYWCERVKSKARRRQLISGCGQIVGMAADTEALDSEVFNTAERLIFDIACDRRRKTFEQAGVLAEKELGRIESFATKSDSLPGVASGLIDLDFILGNFQKQNQIIVAARPSVGKTSLGLGLALNAAMTGQPSGFVSLEMSDSEISMRLLSMIGRVDLHRIRTGRLGQEEWRKLSDALVTLSNLPLYIDDSGGLTLTEIRSKARQLKARHGLGLLLVDYLGLIVGERKGENRNQEVGEISRRLKSVAKELDVPLIALSQLSRKSEDRADKEPTLSDLRDSGELEQNADVVVFIHRDDYYKETEENRGRAKLIVAKQRNGPTGHCEVYFEKRFAAFQNLYSA